MITDDKDPRSTWLTRLQAADLLGVSHNTLRNLEIRGRLHPSTVIRRDDNGVNREMRVYDPAELVKIPRRERYVATNDPGEIAARAFELFDAGKGMRAVVVATRQLPSHIADLHQQWLDSGGASWVVNAQMREILERAVGPCESIADVVERVEILAGEAARSAQDLAGETARSGTADAGGAQVATREKEDRIG